MSKNDNLSQTSSDSFFSRFMRGRSEKSMNSDSSDVDTLGVVLPDHIEPSSVGPKSTPMSSKQGHGRGGTKNKNQSEWWSQKSSQNRSGLNKSGFKSGNDNPNLGREQSSSLNSTDSELDISRLAPSRHYKILLVASGLLFIVSLGLGWTTHQKAHGLNMQKQGLEQSSLEVSSVLGALYANTPNTKTLLNISEPSPEMLARFPNLQQGWEGWSKTASQLSQKLDANDAYRKHATDIAQVLKSGWNTSRGLWGRAGQANQWGNQVLVSQSIDGLIAWSNLASDVASGKPLDGEASVLEKNITQSLQATSSLNNDTSLLGQTWKSVAQTWINARPTLLDLIAQAPAQNEVVAQKEVLKNQSKALKEALNDAILQATVAESSASSQQILALGVFVLSVIVLILALFLQSRQTKFVAVNARQDLNRQSHGLEQMGEVLKDVKSGHWQTRLPVKTGVLGEVSHEINSILDLSNQWMLGYTKNFKDLGQRLENIQTQSGELTDKSHRLLEVLAQSGSTLLVLEENTEEMEKQSLSIDQVLAQSKLVGKNGEETVQGIGKNMGDLQSRIQEIARSIESLTETSKQVDGYIENLSHLAARAEVLSIQTDLRAVQSTEGEPFRLVAQEMHALAEENEALVKRIAGLAESLIREAQVALEGVQGATKTTDGVARLVDLTEDAWRQLSSHSGKVIEVVEKMREASANQSQVVNELSEHAQEGLTLLQDMNKQSGLTHRLSHDTLSVCQTLLSELSQKI